MTKVKKIKNAPSWLGLSSDRTSFVVLSERADILREIFQLSIDGFGAYSIAKLLNKKQVPGFGSSKKWDKSTVHLMLNNRAAIGEYQRKQTISGKEALIGKPVADYYPAVIDAATFEAAQLSRQQNMANRSGRRGKVITNLFFGIASCFYCSHVIKFSSNGGRSLVCSEVLSGSADCPRFAWTYQNFENSFFDTVAIAAPHLEFSGILRALQNSKEDSNEPALLEARMRMISFLRRSVKSIVIAAAGKDPPTPQPHSTIRRDNPDRFFEVTFTDGFSLKGFPRLLQASVQSEPRGRKIDAAELARTFGLSPRQAQITSLLVQGFSLKQAADKLDQTIETARWHLREIFRRTNTHSQSELIQLAERTCDQMKTAEGTT